MYPLINMRQLPRAFRDKKLIVFDLDGTLTPSKAPMHKDMSRLLARLLRIKMVAVIGGAKYSLFKWQFINRFRFPREELKNLFLFPTSSTAFYKYAHGAWRKVYSHALSPEEKKKIFTAFNWLFKKLNYSHPKKVYGEIIEDRETQITFSPLGQKAPIPLKERWRKRNNALRFEMARMLQRKLPQFNVRVGGITSIDVTEKGLDKAYGIRQIEKTLGVKRKDMFFVGDAIFPGGNDYAVVRAGVDYVKVSGPQETKKVIQFLLSDSR